MSFGGLPSSSWELRPERRAPSRLSQYLGPFSRLLKVNHRIHHDVELRAISRRDRRYELAWRGEVGSVVGEDGMDLVRDGGDQAAQEVSRGATRQALNLRLAEASPSTCGNREISWRCRHR